MAKCFKDRYKPAAYIADNNNIPAANTGSRSFLESILNEAAPMQDTIPPPTRLITQYNELTLYLEEPTVSSLGVMEYWQSREKIWPNLARMAYDFLSIPAMSSECERTFSKCAKLTRQESSRLSGDILWHWECLANWEL